MGEEGEVEAFGRGDGRAGLDGKSGRGEIAGSASREFDGRWSRREIGNWKGRPVVGRKRETG